LNQAIGFSETDNVPSNFSSRPSVTHSIGFLEPAPYEIVVRLRGEEMGAVELIATPIRESELDPFTSRLVIREVDGSLVADLTLPLPPHLNVRDWGSPELEPFNGRPSLQCGEICSDWEMARDSVKHA
jgi:hypothetical protein